jgi:hypothetical protein
MIEVISRQTDNSSNSKNLSNVNDLVENSINQQKEPQSDGSFRNKEDNINDIDGIDSKYTKVIKQVEGNISINENNTKSTVSDNLLAFDKKTAYDITRGENNVIVTTKEEVKEYVVEALKDTNSNKTLHIGVIPNETIIRIKNEITDIKQEKINSIIKENTQYDLAINQKEIRHLKKESLSENDVVEFIDTLDELIVNFDTVRYTVYNNNQSALRFKKKMSDGTHIALEVISNKKNTLRTHTLFLDQFNFENKKRSLSPTLNEFKNSLSKTSKMDGALASYDNNIAYNNEKVKSFIANNSNMQDTENNDINL